MMDFFFFVKTLILTLALILVMQIPVGEQSFETHAMSWMQSSVVISPLRNVAKGAVKMVNDLSQKISNAIHKNTGKNKKEESAAKRSSSFQWTRGSKAADSHSED